MDLISFSGKRIHGYLDISIQFNDNITFLTGINGSGKTTALNCIVSLLFPKIQFLCELNFVHMELDILDEGKKKKIWCSKADDGIALGCTEIDDVLLVNAYLPDPSMPSFKRAEHEVEYYTDVISSNRGHAYMQFLSRLPSPMYLGLDRRIILSERNANNRLRRGFPRRNAPKSGAFSNSLEASFFEAIDLAEDSQQRAQIEMSAIDREFQRKLLMELIQIEPFEFASAVSIPNKKELGRLVEAQRRLRKLSSLMGMREDEVTNALTPILTYLTETAKKIESRPAGRSANSKVVDFADPISEHIFNWNSNQQNLKKILKISHHIDEHNEKSSRINEKNNQYLHAINRFLHASKKLIDFDARGNVTFKTNAGDAVRGIESLSSGEVQVFVIITHLFFNPNAQIGNVFIIDEPELSLHIQWQEMFVDSILEASNGVQFVLATHSPSVILGRVDACVEVTS